MTKINTRSRKYKQMIKKFDEINWVKIKCPTTGKSYSVGNLVIDRNEGIFYLKLLDKH